MYVAGARRCVEDKVVELAPVGIGYQLLQSTRSHSATPESGSGGGYEETDGEQFDSILLDGTDKVAAVFLHSIGTLVLYVEHLGHRGPEDICVEQSYFVAQTR